MAVLEVEQEYCSVDLSGSLFCRVWVAFWVLEQPYLELRKLEKVEKDQKSTSQQRNFAMSMENLLLINALLLNFIFPLKINSAKAFKNLAQFLKFHLQNVVEN